MNTLFGQVRRLLWAGSHCTSRCASHCFRSQRSPTFAQTSQTLPNERLSRSFSQDRFQTRTRTRTRIIDEAGYYRSGFAVELRCRFEGDCSRRTVLCQCSRISPILRLRIYFTESPNSLTLTLSCSPVRSSNGGSHSTQPITIFGVRKLILSSKSASVCFARFVTTAKLDCQLCSSFDS